MCKGKTGLAAHVPSYVAVDKNNDGTVFINSD